MLGLYVHVPFCSAICNYCNFNRGLFDADLKARYVDAIVIEIEQAGLKARTTTEPAGLEPRTTSDRDPAGLKARTTPVPADLKIRTITVRDPAGLKARTTTEPAGLEPRTT